jgi:SNF2 family DNA or RNA helicase
MILYGTWTAGERVKKPFFSIWAENNMGPAHRVMYCNHEELISMLRLSTGLTERVSIVAGSIVISGNEVDALSLFPAIGTAGDFLAQLLRLERQEEASSAAISIHPSLSYWIRAANTVRRILTDQHFIPFVETRLKEHHTETGDTLYNGIWDPLLDDPGLHHRLAALHEALTELYSINGAAQPEPHIPIEGMWRHTGHFMRMLVDLFVRETLSQEEIKLWMTRLNPNYVAPLKPTEHWLHSLFTAPRTQGVPSLEWIAEEIVAWRTNVVSEQSQAGFRTCFQLEEPDNEETVLNAADGQTADHAKREGDPPSVSAHLTADSTERMWKLRYYLQALDDPSLLVPAQLVWGEENDRLRFVNYRFHQPQEKLLRDLGRAASLFAPLSESLNSVAPYECQITTAEAHSFLTDGAQYLQREGFGIFVPSWWQHSRSQPTLRMKLQSPPDASRMEQRPHQTTMFGFDTLLQFDWQVALNGEILTREHFEQLASLKIPLLQVRGKWLEFTPDQTNQLLQFFQQRSGGPIRLAGAIQLALQHTIEDQEKQPSAFPEAPVPITDIMAEGQLATMLAHLKNENMFHELRQPDDLRGALRPYQITGLSWLVGMRRLSLGACLADDMGLGKTIQWIAYILHLKQTAAMAGSALLICPTSVIGNWQRELERFAPTLRIWLHYGAGRLSGEQLANQVAHSDIVITSYATAQRDESDLASVYWDVVTLDEAQNIKNSSAKQTQSIRSLDSNHRIALTGTPVENRLTELWSIMEFLNPDYLGSQDTFIQRFAAPIEKYQDTQKASMLHRIVKPFIMRRVKSDQNVIRDLPDKQESKVFCSLTREQVTLYEAYVQNVFTRMEKAQGMGRKGIILAALTHLKQICNDPAHFLGESQLTSNRSGKLMRLVELVNDIQDQGERILIFTQYAVMAELLHKFMQQRFQREVLLLHGKVPKQKRDEMIARFQEAPDGPSIFVLSLKTGGYGLNLTRANHVFHFDRWWNPAVENQATDRAYRIGQQKNVQVHKFICVGTLEERIDQMIESKRELASTIIGNGEQWLTELSTDDLRDIFTLRRNVLVEADE